MITILLVGTQRSSFTADAVIAQVHGNGPAIALGASGSSSSADILPSPRVRLFDLSTTGPPNVLPGYGYADVALVPPGTERAGDLVIAAGTAGRVIRFDPEGGHVNSVMFPPADSIPDDSTIFQPRAVAVAPDGHVFSGWCCPARVLHFDDAGRFLRWWPTSDERAPSNRGPWDQRAALAAAPDGSVYVMQSPFVIRYDRTGLREEGINPWSGAVLDMVVDPESADLFVLTNRASERVWRLSANGTSQRWPFDSANDRLVGASHIALGPAGAVHVLAQNNAIVQRFSPDGLFLDAWPWPGGLPQDPLFELQRSPIQPYPDGLAILPAGAPVIVQGDGGRVTTIQRDGDPAWQWGAWGVADDRIGMPGDMALTPEGNLLVFDEAEGAVTTFDPDGTPIEQWGGLGRGEGRISSMAFGSGLFPQAHGLAIGHDGTTYLSDPAGHHVLRRSAQGTWLKPWGGPGSERGQFASSPDEILVGMDDGPGDIAVSRSGDLWIVDEGNDRIQTFDASGAVIRTTALPKDSASALAFTPDDKLLAANAKGIWQRKESVWQLLRAAGTSGSGSCEGDQGAIYGLSALEVIAAPKLFDEVFAIVVLDIDCGPVHVLAPDGRTLARWGRRGSGIGAFSRPTAVVVGPDQSLYVADAATRRIQRFTLDGRLLASWGEEPFPLWHDRSLLDISGPVIAAFQPDGEIVSLDDRGALLRYDQDGIPLGTYAIDGIVGDGVLRAMEETFLSHQQASRDRPSDRRHRPARPTSLHVPSSEILPPVYALASLRPERLLVASIWPRPRISAWDRRGAEGATRMLPDIYSAFAGRATAEHLEVLAAVPAQQRVDVLTASGGYLRSIDVALDLEIHTGPIDVASLSDGRFAMLYLVPDATVPSMLALRIAVLDRNNQPEAAWEPVPQLAFDMGDIDWLIEDSARNLDLASGPDDTLFLSSTEAGETLRFLPDGTLVDHMDGMGHVDLDPQGRMLRVASFDKDIAIYGPSPPRQWRSTYFADRWLSNWPHAVEHHGSGDSLDLNLDWGLGPPGPVPESDSPPWLPQLPPDGWSARLTRYLPARPGPWTFALRVEGGVRLDVAGRRLVDAWDGPSVLVTQTLIVDAALLERAEPGGLLVTLEVNDPGDGGGGAGDPSGAQTAASVELRITPPVAAPGAPGPLTVWLPRVVRGPGR